MAGGCELQINESLYCECRRQPYTKTNRQKKYITKRKIHCRQKSKIIRGQPGMLCYAREHTRSDFLSIMESKSEIEFAGF